MINWWPVTILWTKKINRLLLVYCAFTLNSCYLGCLRYLITNSIDKVPSCLLLLEDILLVSVLFCLLLLDILYSTFSSCSSDCPRQLDFTTKIDKVLSCLLLLVDLLTVPVLYTALGNFALLIILIILIKFSPASYSKFSPASYSKFSPASYSWWIYCTCSCSIYCPKHLA